MKQFDFAKRHLLNRSLLSYTLYPASLVYAGYMFFRRRFLFRSAHRAPFRVISIGNLTSGGSGKSPIAIALARALQNRGLSLAYSSRGYKSPLENSATLVYDGQNFLVDPQSAGDEASMAARLLPGVPVFSGRKRTEVMQSAARLLPDLDIMVLDDAFQHLKVQRDLDIVVFDTKIGLGNGFVIPAGYLRESLAALNPECFLIVHQKPGALPNPQLESILHKTGARIFKAQSRPGTITCKDRVFAPQSLMQEDLSLVSAIADPLSFESSAKELGLSFRRHHAFGDHYDFTDQSTRARLLREPSKYLLCTAKDAGKLGFLGDRLCVLNLETELEPELVDSLIGRLDKSP